MYICNHKRQNDFLKINGCLPIRNSWVKFRIIFVNKLILFEIIIIYVALMNG